MTRPAPSDDDTRIKLTGSAFDSLFVANLQAHEALDTPGTLNLQLHGDTTAVAPATMTGQHATVSLAWADQPHLIDAICTRATRLPSSIDANHYALELRSWFWLLTLSQNNRVFQAKTAQEIIDTVLGAYVAADYKFSLSGTATAREWCVQYGESDFDFVSRLCEEEGWFYFFQHADGSHTLVIADSNDAFVALPGFPTLTYASSRGAARETAQVIHCEIVEQAATGVLSHSDYAWLTPALQLYSQAQAKSDWPTVYEYPGRYNTSSRGSTLTTQRVDALRAPTRLLTGESDCRALAPGFRFTLDGHDDDSANIAWVVREVRHEADHNTYRNRFEAFPADTPWRPARTTKRPFMPTQTAIVVGKSGEEQWTDQYGRVKVQFYWDRDGKNDEQSSCWIRVAQPWASKSFGMQFMPRVGDEVVVTFIDADPDRPLITGSVYNGTNSPPYTLPDNQSQSGIKTNSTKGGGGFNELRFEDKKDNEEIFIQAQKDLQAKVLNDATWSIGHDETSTIENARTHTVKGADDTLVVKKGNRSMTVETGDETVDVKGARTVKAGGNETRTVGGDLSQTITGNMTLTVDGNLTIKVTGTLSLQSTGNLTAKSDASITQQAAMSLTNQAGTSLTNKSDGTLSNEALSLTNKGSVSQTVDGGAALTVKGGIVQIN